MLATVQGDDTLLVVAVEGVTGRAVADRLAALADARRTPTAPPPTPALPGTEPGLLNSTRTDP